MVYILIDQWYDVISIGNIKTDLSGRVSVAAALSADGAVICKIEVFDGAPPNLKRSQKQLHYFF